MEAVLRGQQSGTQALERAVALLREVSAGGHLGLQLSDLAMLCGLRKSTAHRILACLVREGLLRQRPYDRNYVPGPLLFELSLSASPERGELQHAAKAKLGALVKETSGVAFLYYRSGDNSVCALRIGEGRLDAKGVSIFPGTRRPLVLTSTGVAMLLAMPKAESQAVIRRNLATLNVYSPVPIHGIHQMIARSFADGFASVSDEILPGVSGYGLALCDRSGAPFGAIGIGGSTRRFPLERREEMRELLQDTAKGLQASHPVGTR